MKEKPDVLEGTTPGGDTRMGAKRGNHRALLQRQSGGSRMKLLRRFLIRLSNFITQRSTDQRLQEELAGHLAFQTEENLRAGMSPAEARRQAALKLGATQAIREDHHAEHSIPFIENLLFDLRYSIRMLVRSPGFAFVAIATVALGIGATTAIYSVIDATLLHPLPFPNPSELVSVQDDLPGIGAKDVGAGVGVGVGNGTDVGTGIGFGAGVEVPAPELPLPELSMPIVVSIAETCVSICASAAVIEEVFAPGMSCTAVSTLPTLDASVA
jgi:hypothetical protein